VKAEISDIHTDVLKINWLANVRMSDCQLSGHISSVLPTIQYGVITFIIELDIKPERFLRSNLLANIDVIISNVENVVTAKNGPYINGSGLHEIFVIEGDKAFKRRDP
jgi:HlyD family secretion protein